MLNMLKSVLRDAGTRKETPVFIPFKSYQKSLGGPSTFMQNLQNYLDNEGFAYTDDTKQAEAAAGIFFPISYAHHEVLDKLKQQGKPIIQRLDGISYPEKHGDEYEEMNAKVKDIYLNYATHIVFQSEYSKKQCFAMFGEKPKSQYSTIINGVRNDLFSANIELEAPHEYGTVDFITTGNFRDISMLEPVVLALDELVTEWRSDAARPAIKLHVVGPINDDRLEQFRQREYIQWHGSQELPDVARLLNQSHMFIYSHLNPPCPNSVLEAIASGLPIVGFDSGSMSELLHFNLELLASVSEDVFQTYEQFDHKKLKQKLELAVKNYDKHRQLALEHKDEYDFSVTGQKYVQVFNSQLDQHE